MKLQRFWITFDSNCNGLQATGTLLGCGVTAVSIDEAIRFVRERVFEGVEMPGIENIIENVDVSKLDAKHVRPNMGSPAVRGVWYPSIDH
jgi:hypothetical protein